MASWNNQNPMMIQNYNVFINGGTETVGLAETQLPSFEALTQTITGAGIMGELESPAIGQFSAMTLTLNFREIYGDVLNLAVGQPYRFDLRAAVSYEDRATRETHSASDRWSITAVVKKVDPGKYGVASTADASIDASIRTADHYVDGVKVLEFDLTNNKYIVNGKDIYAEVRNAIGG
jgi:P2 family phage contractile tail tube protein